MSLIDFALKVEGVPDDIIADIDAVEPDLLKMLPAIQQLRTVWSRSQPLAQHWDQTLPIVQAAFPNVKAAYPLIVKIFAYALTKA